MAPQTEPPQCPYCGQAMKKWRVPLESTWASAFFFVCFNDECPYFVQGWDHMLAQQAVRASFRCRLDPQSQKFLPLPVWSADALKDDIIGG